MADPDQQAQLDSSLHLEKFPRLVTQQSKNIQALEAKLSEMIIAVTGN